MTAFLVAFAWISTSDSAWKKQTQTLESLNRFDLSLNPQPPPNPVSLSLESKGLVIDGRRNLRRERWWLCVHNVHVWLTSCAESKEQDVSRAAESKGRSSCECDCVAECRVGGMWGRLSSPAYRSTKDNLTLPLGCLPRLPTWHSFYVLLYRCCLFIRHYALPSPPKKKKRIQKNADDKKPELLPRPFRGERFM